MDCSQPDPAWALTDRAIPDAAAGSLDGRCHEVSGAALLIVDNLPYRATHRLRQADGLLKHCTRDSPITVPQNRLQPWVLVNHPLWLVHWPHLLHHRWMWCLISDRRSTCWQLTCSWTTCCARYAGMGRCRAETRLA